MSSPRPWGCFPPARRLATAGTVFPTPVGVFLARRPLITQRRRLPHARGGVSTATHIATMQAGSSPRPWGCFRRRHADPATQSVFPTPVGVFPCWQEKAGVVAGLPHARGGVSPGLPQDIADPESSPRPWGCFRTPRRFVDAEGVFPTPVGVFPEPGAIHSSIGRLPHARGGVSSLISPCMICSVSSPRPWGCF